MITAVADTHAAIWYLDGNPQLSSAATDFIDQALEAGHTIGLSSISLAEMLYLVEKQRIPPDVYAVFDRELREPDWTFTELPLDRLIVQEMRRISRELVRDLPDRIVAATALRFGVPLITRDGQIRASDVPTIW